jgi:hypothetical protein
MAQQAVLLITHDKNPSVLSFISTFANKAQHNSFNETD